MREVLEFAARRAESGERVALVTVTVTRGSSPASAGQVMAVSADGATAGTVGGGASEHRLILRAAEAIKGGEVLFQFDLEHSDEGMVCGGGMAGFGRVFGAEAELVIFGGGHIARSLAGIAAATGFNVTVVEDRAEYASAFDQARYIVCTPDEYERAVPTPDGAYAVICTRGHKMDDEALRFCLTKRLAYIGMIGSGGKVDAVFGRLRSEGAPQEALDRVYAPIGLDVAGGKPAEIAVAIMAEILLVKNGGSPRHRECGKPQG